MTKRFVAIWFRRLITDWLGIRQPENKNVPFVFAAPDHGRMLITATNTLAEKEGVAVGMAVADARSLITNLQVFDDKPQRAATLLKALAEWCIRYTPCAAVDLPDGIILDATGCAHLWGGELPYLTDICNRLQKAGYQVNIAMADTIGAAWAMAHYGDRVNIVESREQVHALLSLPPAALRLSPEIILRLQKLGLYKIKNFISMPRHALHRRFGKELLLRMDQASGLEEEALVPVQPVQAYQERLPCMEPIVTAIGIEIALKRLLETLCSRLLKEEKGIRTAALICHRADGKIESVAIGTNAASHNTHHLFKLFEPKLDGIEPDLGIELFILEASKVEDLPAWQKQLWAGSGGLNDTALAELLDRISNKTGADKIHRYLPAEHYWPERSFKPISDLREKATNAWQVERPRPIQLLTKPEPVEVSAPVPDYPPMLFRYKNKVHTIKKADGPERIEQEWWLEDGPHRDYYYVEDEEGQRYWLFRSGHYTTQEQQWFVHGFFA